MVSCAAEQEEILERTIDTPQFKLCQQEHGPQRQHPNVENEQAFEYSGPRGKQVIGLHHVLLLAGLNWASSAKSTGMKHGRQPIG